MPRLKAELGRRTGSCRRRAIRTSAARSVAAPPVRDEWLKLYATFTPTQKQVVRDELNKRMERFENFRAKMKERFDRQG